MRRQQDQEELGVVQKEVIQREDTFSSRKRVHEEIQLAYQNEAVKVHVGKTGMKEDIFMLKVRMFIYFYVRIFCICRMTWWVKVPSGFGMKCGEN